MELTLAARLQGVKQKIALAADMAGRKATDITLVAVSKGRDTLEIRQLAALGVTDFGENRVQEAVPKIEELTDLPRLNWHLIGSLQTNKARKVLPLVNLVHSLDRFSLARELERLGIARGVATDCLVQVNIAGEKSKSGLNPREVDEFVQTVANDYPLVAIRGLMTIAPQADDAESVRIYFRAMKALFDELKRKELNYRMEFLSMGMTADYSVAIEEGANMVRIGTAIFGRRDAL